jgi:hypothetical protein
MRTAVEAILAAAMFATQPPPPAAAPAGTYDLDIAEKRIRRPDLEAGTALRVGDGSRGVEVQVGASVTASAVDILLRDVKGTVRFRFDTSRLRARAASPEPEAPTPRQQ